MSMNRNLSNIEQLINQSGLADEEKQALLKEISNADKQWNILEFKLERTEQVKQTTGVLLEETIEELERKRKAVEEKNRDLEIESSLERVRTVAMSMRTADDLLNICQILFEELTALGFGELRNAMINIVNDEKGSFLNYDFNGSATSVTPFLYNSHPVMERQVEMTRSASDAFFEHVLTGDNLEDFKAFRVRNGEPDDPKLENISALYYYFYSIGVGSLGISAFTSLSEEKRDVLKRFRNVFDLAYRRYADIQLAETQARESQIELALERVRARTMAMQHSEELAETAFILFQQFKELGENPDQATIGIINEEEHVIEYWVTMYGSQINKVFKFSIDEPNVTHKIYKGWKTKKKSLVIDLSGKALTDFATYRQSMGGAKLNKGEKRHVINVAFFSKGLINVQSTEARSEESVRLLERFAGVFEGTYTRFLDLKKAEAQARESQIELALERVRARTMAMQHSDELHDVIQLVFEQFQQLNFDIDVANFALNYKETDDFDLVLAVPHGKYPMKIHVPYFQHPVFDRFNKAKNNGGLLADEFPKNEKDSFFEHFFKYVPGVPEDTKALIFGRPGFVRSTILMKNTALTIHNYNGIPYSEAENNILLRFGHVFEQTYTRFNDLQKSEAQARESQIELALERVRARTMAMQHSTELPETANLLFQQVQELSMPAWSAGYCNWIDNKTTITFWMSSEGVLQPPFNAPTTKDPSFIHMREAAERGETFYVEAVGGGKLVKHYQYMHTLPVVGEVLDSIIAAGHPLPTFQIFHLAYFAHGFLLFITYEPVPEAHGIFKRFAKVFEQTYTRFLDLKKAEAQVREAQIEAALERTRTQSMIMQHSNELDDTLRVFHQQVLHLGINSAFSFLWLPDEEKYRHIFWAAWAENNSNDFRSKAVDYPLDRSEPATAQCLVDWKGNEPVVSYHVPPEGVKGYFAAWQELIDGVEQLKPEYFPCGLYYVEAFIKYGCFGVMVENPLTEEEKKILGRLSVEFERTYTRFLDLKKAEAQAREAQIEAALEKVRSRSLAMHKSEELDHVVALVAEKLRELGVEMEGAVIFLPAKEGKGMMMWSAMTAHMNAPPLYVPYGHPLITEVGESWKNGVDFFGRSWTYEEKTDFWAWAFENSDFKHLPDFRKDQIRQGTGYALSVAFEKNSGIAIPSHIGKILSDVDSDVLKRLAKVFDQAYIRFNDLQKAEAQTREAQIEAALEKVRSRSLAMHQTDELREVVSVVFEKLHDLGIVMGEEAASIVIFTEGTKDLILWNAIPDQLYSKSFNIPYYDTAVISSLLDAKSKGADFFERNYTPEEKDHFWKWAVEYSDYKNIPDERKKRILDAKYFACSVAYTKNSAILVSSYQGKLLSEKEGEILKRFARVFEQAYVRFLDLHKAELQAREAKIELSLERVRAKTMAMHTSEHVGDTVAAMFDELVRLGIEKTVRCGILIIDETKHMEVWTAAYDPDGKVNMLIGRIDMMIHPITSNIHQAWQNKEQVKTYELAGKDLKEYYRAINDSPEYPVQFDLASLPKKQINNAFMFPEGAIFAFTLEPLTDDEVKLFKRFAGVFGLTYRRFLDLQKAEKQAREAQVEAALERVRSKTMAMHNSQHVAETVAAMVDELIKLGIDKSVRSGIGIISENKQMEVLTAYAGPVADKIDLVIGHLDMTTHQMLSDVFNNWKKKKEHSTYMLTGDDQVNYYKAINNADDYSFKFDIASLPERQFQNAFYFREGFIYVFTHEQLTAEEVQIYKRFAGVFGLTYRRYLDLLNAESQAREAIKQASVDRVRGEIASMRSTKDLERITPLIWNELTILGIPFIRCGVFIVDEQEQLMHTHLSTADGRALATFNLQFDSEGIGRDLLPAWRQKQVAVIHWTKEEFANYTKNLVNDGTVKSEERYVTEHPDTSLDLHFMPFLQGMLYVGNIAPLTENEMGLVQSLADAFSTAYARYQDFNKLEAAKQQVENTLTDLKATQTKLIQSEKMASLGELTAGIAHEIQNPLNFVNNFSEVNQEMIEELEEELKAGNIDEALAIAADIKGNEQKINHHGKRADGIVKGMLQHSRTGGGEKQPTNMNSLADEFLRLSYHGLRAKDKLFNAEMITHFDPDLPKINVIPQDMGRVMLNLFNNAFYAVNQKMKTSGVGYRPEVSVTTSSENGRVIIKVKDNGIGMPEHVKEKIMQPFFTTKPTGEGTGLGLSLTYDMVVKGHGGSIDAKTKIGEYTEFIVSLPLS